MKIDLDLQNSEHIKILNEEMGQVRDRLAVVETKITNICEKLSKIDNRQWYIVTGIIVNIGITIVLKLIL